MSYTKTIWSNDRSPAINATNLNHLEAGLYAAHEAIAAVQNFQFVVVDTLPAASEATMNKIYLVPKPGVTTGKDQYITVHEDSNYSWLLIGTTTIDLDDYYTKSAVDNMMSLKQTVLVSGTNIKTINNESVLGEGNITIQGGGSLSPGTIAGQVPVWNSTQWVNQEGYGYDTPGLVLFDFSSITAAPVSTYYSYLTEIDLDLIEGNFYVVHYNDVRYGLQATTHDGKVCLGEWGTDAPDFTHYPFFMYQDEHFRILSTNQNFSAKLQHNNTHKIATRFIPNLDNSIYKVINVTESGETLIADKTFSDIKALYDADEYVIIVNYDNVIYNLDKASVTTTQIVFENSVVNRTQSKLQLTTLTVNSSNTWAIDDSAEFSFIPTTGLAKNKLASDVQASLGKADTAKQNFNELDKTVSGTAANRTLASLTETDGLINATFQDIAITKSQVTDLNLNNYYTKTQTDAALAGKANTNHTHQYAGSTTAGGAANGVAITTSAPTSDNTDGDLKFAILSSDPDLKYSGYFYIITG